MRSLHSGLLSPEKTTQVFWQTTGNGLWHERCVMNSQPPGKAYDQVNGAHRLLGSSTRIELEGEIDDEARRTDERNGRNP